MNMAYGSPSPFQRAVRLMNGNAANHFQYRSSNWAMAGINTLVGLAMAANPGMLTTNPGADVYFAHLVSWISPDTWRNLFLVMGLVRLAALYINGTFPSLWFTPHVRLTMAFLSFLVWGQFAISILTAGVISIGCVLFSATVCVEGYNVVIAARETRSRPEWEIG